MCLVVLFGCCLYLLRVFPSILLHTNKYAGMRLVAIALLAVSWVHASGATGSPTTTTLALTYAGSATNSVASGSVVTLTSSVKAGSAAVTAGQVKFCDAAAAYCTDIHVVGLGVAQLTSTGTAVVKFRPAVGSHSYKAVFVGTNTYAGSTSGASTLTVTGTTSALATTTTITETGSFGNYALTATVTESGSTVSPAGNVSFVDTSRGNSVLDTTALGPGVAGINWPNPQGLTTQSDTEAVALGDFNNDGIPDLALSAGPPETPLSILLGNADGSYSAAPLPAVSGYSLRPIAVADFNGDGKQDLAVLDGDASAVTILLGNGDGTFHANAASPATGPSPIQLAVGDFNGDGLPDLAVASNSTSLTILLGNGDGTFTASATSPTLATSPMSIAVGDFNGDGAMDLVMTDIYDDTVSVLLGNGDGTFATPSTFACGSKGSPIAVADFNADGKLDLVVGVSGSAGASDSVLILSGKGDGTFTLPAAGQVVNSNAISSVQVGDFNADGVPDVALTDSTGTFTVLLGTGSGSFTATSSSVPSTSYFQLVSAVGDINGDGRTDLVIGNGFSGTVLVELTQPTETATATANLSIAGVGQHRVDASYGGDSSYNASLSGTLSVWGVPPATTTSLSVTSSGAQVTTVTPGSVVALTAAVTAGASPVTSGQVQFCDASASACTDIHLLGAVALSSSGTATYKFVPGPGAHSYKAVFLEEGYGMGSSSAVSMLNVGPAPAVVYTDMTNIAANGSPGDYALTATVVGYGGPASPTGNISFLDTSFGNTALATAPLGASTAGLGWLISQTSALGGNPTSEVTGDFNGDGIQDLALLWTNTNTTTNNSTAACTIFFGQGDGTFSTGPTTQTQLMSMYAPPFLLAGDFNGDGKTDLVLLAYVFSADYFIDTVTTLLGHGDGTFTVSAASTVYNQGAVGGDFINGSMSAGDFNGDGKMDLAVVGDYVGYGGVTIVLGNGDGTFTAAGPNLELNQDFGLVATGDFNGDGIPDLVATQYFDPGGATIFLGKGDGTFATTATTLAVDRFPSSIVVGDLNGDGRLDLAFGYDGAIELYLGNGDGTFHQAPGSPVQGAGQSLVAGDFNHDGKLDLAGIDNYDLLIDVFLGAGDGTFTTVLTTPNISQEFLGPLVIAAADFNQDGVPDLALLTKNVNTASILLTEPTQTATASVSNLAPIGGGTHNVEASYPGDAHYGATLSSTVPLTAGLAPLVLSTPAGTYSSSQTLTISESVPGATIYYEAFGTVSTSGFVPYTGPIALNEGGVATIQAYATEAGYQQSNTATATYQVILPAAPAPALSLASGVYPGAEIVTISDAAAGATIYYTTNGTFPTLSAQQYTGPIQVSLSQTLAAVAIAPGYSLSAPVSAQYLIGSSSQGSLIYTIAGNGSSGYAGDGGLATEATLNYPGATVQDSAGNLYIADANNNVIRKVAAGTGIISTFAGNGTSGDSGDNGPAASAQLSDPAGLAMDSAGNLYIADSGNTSIRKVTAATGVITTLVNAATSGTYFQGLAIDSAGNLYVAESANDQVVKYGPSGAALGIIAGTGQYGYSGDGGPASSATLAYPTGVALDAAGNVYIADSLNNVIRKVTASTGVISTVAGTGPANGSYSGNGGYSGDGGPATSAQMNYPQGVAIDSGGDLYIADTDNNVIRMVSAASGIISTVAGNGVDCEALGGDGGPATNVALCYPQAVSIGAAGNLYVGGDQGRIRRVTVSTPAPTATTATPVFSVTAGTYANTQTVTITDSTPGAAIYLTLDGSTPSTASPLYAGPLNVSGSVKISAIAVAPGYLTSAPATAGYTITTPPTAVISTIAGTGAPGLSGSSGQAISTPIGSPAAVTLDRAGNLYFADATNSVVWKVAAATGAISTIAGNGSPGYSGDGGAATSAQLNSPSGIAVDSAGNLYIADTSNDVIREVTASTGLISTVAGVYDDFGFSGTYGNNGPANAAQLEFPTGVALDSSGNLYIADGGHQQVRLVSASSGIITAFAGNGTAGFSGDGGPATSAEIDEPSVVTLDSAGNVYIANSYYGRVRKVAAATGIITTVAGNGNDGGTSGDGGLATSAEIDAGGLAVDAAGNLYLADGGSEIRKVAAGTGIITRVSSGYYGYSGDGGSAAVAEVAYPQGIAIDASGNLYFADSNNYRVRKITFPGPAAAPSFSIAAGAYPSVQTVSITDSVAGAILYYTTDGTTPSTASILYSGPVLVAQTETLQAIAVATGYTESPATTAAYTINLPIGTAAATLTVTPSAQTITNQQPASLTVSVAGSSGQPAPTGTIHLMSGAYASSQPLSAGTATFTIPAGSLSSGANTLTASYSGDATYAATTGSSTVTVSQIVVSAAALAAVSPAGSATSTLTITAGNNYAGTLVLACALTGSPTGAQSLPTCSLKPASVTIASAASVTSVLTIQTTAGSNTALLPADTFRWLGGSGAVMAALLLGLPAKRRRWTSLLALLLVTLSASLVGCGGGGNSTSSTTQATPATTAGTYTFTLSGTDQVDSKTSASTTVSLTVQ